MRTLHYAHCITHCTMRTLHYALHHAHTALRTTPCAHCITHYTMLMHYTMRTCLSLHCTVQCTIKAKLKILRLSLELKSEACCDLADT